MTNYFLRQEKIRRENFYLVSPKLFKNQIIITPNGMQMISSECINQYIPLRYKKDCLYLEKGSGKLLDDFPSINPPICIVPPETLQHILHFLVLNQAK